MRINVQPKFHHTRMAQTAMLDFHKVGTGKEQERVSEVVGPNAKALHLVIKVKGESVVVPRGGEGTDHDVEGVVVWVVREDDMGKEK